MQRVADRFRQRVGLGALIVESVKLDHFSSVLLFCVICGMCRTALTRCLPSG
jgi:hypothetical protein